MFSNHDISPARSIYIHRSIHCGIDLAADLKDAAIGVFVDPIDGYLAIIGLDEAVRLTERRRKVSKQ